MNVLILTPDAVGSTLLQRLITIYMQFHEFDRPVINLHELTNGLEKYYSPDFNREIVSKKRVENWGYYQSLQEVVEMLSSVDHYKTSRLAQYHIRLRQDPIEQQIPFYRYLDDNFFVIACRRKNVFEHALSMCINRVTKKLNVYDAQEKIQTFIDLYKNPIEVDQQALISTLESYKDYISWSENHFNIGSYFNYETNLENIEKYILNLPIFSGQHHRISWKDKFDIDFDDWNRCHHVTSDIGSLILENKIDVQRLKSNHKDKDLVESYKATALPHWPSVQTVDDFHCLPETIKSKYFEISENFHESTMLSSNHRNFYDYHSENYNKARDTINTMIDLDIIVSPPPIKKQSFEEKKHMIRNFDQCVHTYNDWILKNPEIGDAINQQSIDKQIKRERKFWVLAREVPTTDQLFLPPI